MIALSQDGYVRLTFRDLIDLPMRNICNEFNDDIGAELRAQGVPAEHAGISEWCSDTVPAVSLGFTFFSDRRPAAPDRLHLAPEPVRGNVMLVDCAGYDLGPDNGMVLRLWSEYLSWRAAVAGSASACA